MLVYLQKKEPKLSVELLMDNLRYLLALDKECFIGFKDMKSQSIKNFEKKKNLWKIWASDAFDGWPQIPRSSRPIESVLDINHTECFCKSCWGDHAGHAGHVGYAGHAARAQ